MLPQVAAVVLIVAGKTDHTDLAWIPVLTGYGLSMMYAALILSFLGGIWWGFAMRCGVGQGQAVALAVMPSLIAFGCLATAAAGMVGGPDMPPFSTWAAVALGSAVMLTLLVDRRLVATGEAPVGWMRLRVPLSLGLGLLTIAAGALVGG